MDPLGLLLEVVALAIYPGGLFLAVMAWITYRGCRARTRERPRCSRACGDRDSRRGGRDGTAARYPGGVAAASGRSDPESAGRRAPGGVRRLAGGPVAVVAASHPAGGLRGVLAGPAGAPGDLVLHHRHLRTDRWSEQRGAHPRGVRRPGCAADRDQASAWLGIRRRPRCRWSPRRSRSPSPS